MPSTPSTASSRSPSNSPGRLLLLLPVAAVAVPLLVLAASAATAWRSVWNEATVEMERTADAAAEYVLRVLEGHRVAVDRVNEILLGLSDDEIRANEVDLRNRVRSLLGSLPLLATSFVIDRGSRALLSASTNPVPRDVDLSDREFFIALSSDAAPPLHVSRVLVGRLDGVLFLAVSRRREGGGNGVARGGFDGVINVSGDPKRLSAGFVPLRRADDDTITLLRDDGHVIARSPGSAEPLPPFPAASHFHAVVAGGGTRSTCVARSWVDGLDRIFAVRRVGDLPVWASANRSRATVLARWRETVLGQAAIAVPAALGLLARRSRSSGRSGASRAPTPTSRLASPSGRPHSPSGRSASGSRSKPGG